MSSRVPPAVLEGLLISLVVVSPFLFGCVEPWSRALLESVAYLTAFACFLRGRSASNLAGGIAWVFPALVAALGCAQVFGAVPAGGPWPAGPFTASVHDTAASVQLWLAYASVLYAAPRVITNPDAARRFARALFFAGVAVAALGLLQSWTSTDMIYWFRPTVHDAPPFGPFYNRDHAANFMMMAFAVGCGLLASTVKRWSSVDGPLPPELAQARRLGAGLLLLLSAIVYCNSRGALLAMPLAGAAVGLAAAGFAKRASARWGAALGAVGGAAFVGLCVFAYLRAGSDVGVPLDRSVAVRLTIYEDCARWLADAPLFGTGLGTFSAVYPSYQDQSLRALVLHAHSDWLEFLLETGACGAALLLTALVGLAWASIRSWRKARSREMRALIGGALAAGLAFAVHSLFEFNFQIPSNAVCVLALAGFLVSSHSWADKGERIPRSTAPDALPAGAAFACLVIATWSAVLPAAAAWSATRLNESGERVDGLTRALDLDDDPVFVRDLAGSLLRLTGDGAGELVLRRAAAGFALDAAAARPYDSVALYNAGAGLARLGRDGDAREFFDRAALVRFSPFRVYRAAPAETPREQLKRETLRQLKSGVKLPEKPLKPAKAAKAR